jgi:hypothetical protein
VRVRAFEFDLDVVHVIDDVELEVADANGVGLRLVVRRIPVAVEPRDQLGGAVPDVHLSKTGANPCLRPVVLESHEHREAIAFRRHVHIGPNVVSKHDIATRLHLRMVA